MLKKLSVIFLVVASGLMMTTTSVRADMVPANLVGYCINNPFSHWCDSDFTTSYMLFDFSFFGLIYLFYFAINHTAEYIVGLKMGFSKRPHWALTIFQMNLVTHLAFAIINWLTSIFYAPEVVWFLCVMALGIIGWLLETLILQRWSRLHANKGVPAFTFTQALKYSLIINLIGFLTVVLVLGAMVLYMDNAHDSSSIQFPVFAVILSLIGIWTILLLRRTHKPKTPPAQS